MHCCTYPHSTYIHIQFSARIRLKIILDYLINNQYEKIAHARSFFKNKRTGWNNRIGQKILKKFENLKTLFDDNFDFFSRNIGKINCWIFKKAQRPEFFLKKNKLNIHWIYLLLSKAHFIDLLKESNT